MKQKQPYRKEEAINEFQYIVQNYILPLLPVSGKLRLFRIPIGPDNMNRLLKVYNHGRTLAIYPTLETPQVHFRINLDDPKYDLGAAETILREIMKVSRFDYRNGRFTSVYYYDKRNIYRNSRFDLAFEYGLCMWLGGETIFDLLQKLKHWSQKTYEGKHISFSFIVDASKKQEGEIDYIKFLDSNHSAVFTDGFSSGIKLDNLGRIVKYFSTSHRVLEQPPRKMPLVPYRFQEFAEMCNTNQYDENWVGIIAQSSGDILIFKKKELCFANRNAKWLPVNSYRICQIIAEQVYEIPDEEEKERFSKEVYVSLLDVSFSRAGGCLAIIDKDCVETVKHDYIFQDDLDQDKDANDDRVQEKKSIIKKLVSTETKGMLFQYIDRKLRLDLLSLDGATVIDTTGRILSAGAIVRIKGGSDGGGRSAATKQLAQYGMAMKISMDGKIECYRRKRDGSEDIEQAFALL